MTRSFLIPAALAVAVFATAAAPAFAVKIKRTNRAEGDPAADLVPRTSTRAARPIDASGPHYFDKTHEDANHG